METLRYEILKDGSCLWVTVVDGTVTQAESPTHGCFEATFLGESWDDVAREFEAEGFTVHGGH